MTNRIYKHRCKDCDTIFYVEELYLIKTLHCPKCSFECVFILEKAELHKMELAEPSHIRQLVNVLMNFSKRKPVTDKQPLLTIELQDESSVPKVIYKGEEIKLKKHVSFGWDSSDEFLSGGLSYAIEHYERKGNEAVLNRIERRTKDHI